jgi:hypothetical protein
MAYLENNKIIRNFITKDEASQIINWIDSVEHGGDNRNHHLKQLSKELNGKSYIFDISNTPLTNYITNFQSIYNVSNEGVPTFIHTIIDKIAKEFGFSKDNIFLQAVDMREGGKIHPHYDASISGYINYKCNISVLSEDYDFYIDKTTIEVRETDLYGFEASLYKHWTDEFKSRRVFLSIGFILSYNDLNREINDPRVRLSRRIEKYFQK